MAKQVDEERTMGSDHMVGSKISNRKKVLNETWCAEAGALA